METPLHLDTIVQIFRLAGVLQDNPVDTSPLRSELPFVLARRVARTPHAEWRMLRQGEGTRANDACLAAARQAMPLHDNYQTNRARVQAEAGARRRAMRGTA